MGRWEDGPETTDKDYGFAVAQGCEVMWSSERLNSFPKLTVEIKKTQDLMRMKDQFHFLCWSRISLREWTKHD